MSSEVEKSTFSHKKFFGGLGGRGGEGVCVDVVGGFFVCLFSFVSFLCSGCFCLFLTKYSRSRKYCNLRTKK